MKPKFICDNCQESLKKLIEEGNTIYMISDSISGFGVMIHSNCKHKIILCEECEEIYRQEMIENQQWMDLELLEGVGCKDYFKNYEKLKEDIDNGNGK